MPNWCDNELDVLGPVEELQRFVDATKFEDKDNKKTGYYLSHLYPCPKELQDTVAGSFADEAEQAQQNKIEQTNLDKYGFKNWYDWANTNWGTKWGDCEFDWTCFEEDDDKKVAPTDQHVSAHYQTAWSPADGLIRNISGQFPTLYFTVVSTEESDAFACYSIFHNGNLVAEGGMTPVVTKEITKAFDENSDEAYGLLDDWRCQYSDEIRDEASNALGRLVMGAKINSGAKM